MGWLDSGSRLAKSKDGLAALGSLVQMVGFIVASTALVVASCQFRTAGEQLQLARRALQSTTAWQAQKEGREILTSLYASGAADCIFDQAYWSAEECTDPKKKRLERDRQITRLIQFYSAVVGQRAALGDDAMATFGLEFCQTLGSRPVRIFWQDTVLAGAYSPAFKEFGNACLSAKP